MSLTVTSPSAATYAVASQGAGTIAAYRSAWTGFIEWCGERGRPSLPTTDDALADYIAHRADRGHAVSSIRVALAAIKKAHELAEIEYPRTRRADMVLEGVARTIGTAPRRQARAISIAVLRQMIEATPSARNRALLLIGFGAALRRSELAALDVRDVAFDPRGLMITIRRSKGDQTGKGHVISIAAGSDGLCPVAELRAYLGDRRDGPLFANSDGTRLCDKSIARIITTAAERADIEGVSAHSLRAGMITTAVANGAPLAFVQKHARHVKVDTTAGYVRGRTSWDHNVTVGMWD